MTEHNTPDLTGTHIGLAVAARVDTLLAREGSGTLKTTATGVERRARSVRTRNRIGVIAAALVIGAGGIAGVLRYEPDTRTVHVVGEATTEPLPQLALHAPRFRPVGYYRYPDGPIGRVPQQFHVRNNSQWFDVTLREGDNISGDGDGDGTPVAVGPVSGRLHQQASDWYLVWTLPGRPFAANGGGTMGADVPGILATLTADSSGNVSFRSLPTGYSATQVPSVVESYGVSFSLGREQNTGQLQMEVHSARPFENDYLLAGRRIAQGNRTYFVSDLGPNAIAKPTYRGVTWVEGSAVVSVFAARPLGELLGLADTVVEATPTEWATIVGSRDRGREPTVFMMLDGSVDGTAWEYVSHVKESGAACQNVEFTVGEQSETTCLPDSQQEPIRMIKATTVGNTSILYGVTNDTNTDSYVLRVIDSNDELVAEDVTLDQRSIPGRAFALPLTAGAKGPLTVELYEFDRKWYVDNFDTRPDDSYLDPAAEPVSSVTVDAP